MACKIILNLAISLDGYIADKNDGYDWIEPSGDPRRNTDSVWSHNTFLQQVSVVVMGKRCYDLGMHEEYAQKQVYVVTSKHLEDYENIHFIGGDLCREVSKLKAGAQGNIYLFGGATCILPLLGAGLIDEYIIGVIPMILGEGIPLFPKENPPIPLYLTHSYVADGIVVLRYVPRTSREALQ